MRRALPLLAAVALIIGGCGSSTLSAHDLRAYASTICRQAAARLGHVSQPASPGAALPFLRHGVGVLGPELAGLRRLSPPAGLSARYHATLAEFGAAVERVRATLVLLSKDADPVGAFNALEQQLKPTVASENAGWRTLQIPACVSG